MKHLLVVVYGKENDLLCQVFHLGKYKYKTGKVYHLGNLNPDKTFYVIRRFDYTGLLSYFITHIGCVYSGLKMKAIPVIDMKNYKNTIAGEQGWCKDNPWDWFFNQPSSYNLDEVYKSKNVIFSPLNGIPKLYPHSGMDFFTNKAFINFFHELFEKRIGFSESITRKINELYDECFYDKKDKKVVGVMLRGTDYNAKTAFEHPVQPTIEEAIEKTKFVMKEYKCDYVYLTTEDKDIFDAFLNEFGNSLLYNKNIHFYEYKDGKKIMFNKFDRENDAYLKGEEYICQLALLTKCNCFIAGRTSGSGAVLIWQPNYEYTYFWNKGYYGIDDEFNYEILD